MKKPFIVPIERDLRQSGVIAVKATSVHEAVSAVQEMVEKDPDILDKFGVWDAPELYVDSFVISATPEQVDPTGEKPFKEPTPVSCPYCTGPIDAFGPEHTSYGFECSCCGERFSLWKSQMPKTQSNTPKDRTIRVHIAPVTPEDEAPVPPEEPVTQ
jgi:hypothetical protein